MPCIPDRVTKTVVYSEDECRGRSVKAEISLFMKYVTFCLQIGIKEKEGGESRQLWDLPRKAVCGRKTHSRHPVNKA